MKTQTETQYLSHAYEENYSSFAPQDAPILLGRYRIIELKNSGGFGSVYVCWDTRLQRRVAIKVMPLLGADFDGGEALAEEDAIASTITEALAEARASSHLTHPNIVTVHDFETDGAYAYLVMEYVDGLSLNEILTRVEGGVLLGDEAAYVLQSLANAVEYAHENGVLHLDIKPSNVLIDKDGRVLLADFGMASLQSAMGFADARGGTVGYMPPEQIDGEVVDERADIFSLGTVGYQAISGTSPFSTDTAEKSKKLIQKGPKPLENVDVALVGMVEEALAPILAADAGERPIQAVEAFAPVVQYLGNPEEGRASLQNLLNQTSEEEEEFDESVWRNFDPVARRIPWLPSLLARITNGLLTGFFVWELLPFLGITDGLLQTIVSLVVLAGACIFAPLGAGLGLLVLSIALFSCGVSTTTILVAICALAASAAWMFFCSPESSLSASSVLAAPLLRIPSVAPSWSAYSFGPLRAAATALFSAATAQLCIALFDSNPGSLLTTLDARASAGLFSQNIIHFLTNPAFWLSLGIFGVSAAFASFLSRFRNPGKVRLVVAQILCFGGILCALSLQAGFLGTSGTTLFWGFPALIPSLFGLAFCVVMSVVSLLFGIPYKQVNNLEGEDELS